MLLLLPACGSGGLMRHGVRCEQDGWTALMRASVMGHTEVSVQLLAVWTKEWGQELLNKLANV